MSSEPSKDELDLEFLASVEMFSAFSRDDLALIAQNAQSFYHEFGDEICHTGDPSDGVFLVASGSVRLRRRIRQPS